MEDVPQRSHIFTSLYLFSDEAVSSLAKTFHFKFPLTLALKQHELESKFLWAHLTGSLYIVSSI